jgi:hypothetical protein
MTAGENIASIALDMALTGDRYKEVYEHFTDETGAGAHDSFVYGVAVAGERAAEWEAATGRDFDLIEQSAQVARALLNAWNDTWESAATDWHSPEDKADVVSIVDTVLEWEHTTI